MVELSNKEKEVLKRINAKLTNLIIVLVLFLGGLWLLLYPPTFMENSSQQIAKEEVDLEFIEQGIHVASGLIAAEGYELVNQNCGNCHSYKLVTQNRNTKEGWLETIRWMQETQKLWDLGENEDRLLNYLSTNYGPEETGRRKQLVVTEWYQLN